MRVDISLDLALTDEEERQLARILHTSSEGLPQELGPVASASIQEYIRMFLGQKVFTRGSDVLEYRLYLLIRELFGDQVPNEESVCALFQTTTSGARSLIRSVLSKYQYDLHDAYSSSLKSTLDSAVRVEEDGNYEVTVHTQSLIDGLNRTLAERDGTLPPITKKRGTVCTYVIRPSSFEQLRAAFPVAT